MAPSLPVKIELLERTDAYAIAGWRRLLLLVWQGKATIAGIERYRANVQSWIESVPCGIALLIVLAPGRTEPPDEKTQSAMRQTASRTSQRLKGVATLVEAEGFIAATVRAIMMRLHADGRGGMPNVFGNTAHAAAWAAELLKDPEITSHGLEEVIRLARGIDVVWPP